MTWESPPPDGDQLKLGLWRDQPWDGLSPRALTRGYSFLFLRQKPPRHEVFFDPEQLEFWPVDRATQMEEPPPFLAGAPLLLEP